MDKWIRLSRRSSAGAGGLGQRSFRFFMFVYFEGARQRCCFGQDVPTMFSQTVFCSFDGRGVSSNLQHASPKERETHKR